MEACMLAQRRIGRVKQRSSILSLRQACKTSGRRRGRDRATRREANRRGLQMLVSSADFIDDDFDELDCSTEFLLQLANQL
jgi:hypothetical protein